MGVFGLSGRKALITGGAKGLGAGMAQALSAAGAAVMIGDILDDVGKQTAEDLRSGGGTAGFTHLDVTDDASWEAAITQTVSELGGLDVVVNNAGLEISSLVVDVDADGSSQDVRGQRHRHDARRQARTACDATRRSGRIRRQRDQHLLGGRNHRLPRHRRVLGDQIRRRPVDQSGRRRIRRPRLRRPRQLHLSRPGPDRDGDAVGGQSSSRWAWLRPWRKPSETSWD